MSKALLQQLVPVCSAFPSLIDHQAAEAVVCSFVGMRLPQHAMPRQKWLGVQGKDALALQAVKAAGQRVAQLETANAELRASNRQLVQQVLHSS